jgi:undecaprenyl-diphosphatase
LGSRTRFALNPAVDLSFAGAAIGLNLVPFIVDKTAGAPELPPFDPATVWGFDRAFMAPYNGSLDTLSDITQFAAFFAPAALAAAPVGDWVTIGTMYLETALLAWGLKETGKTLIARARPYLYAEGYPDDSDTREDWFDSFPSGHTSMAFAGAGFASYTFAAYFPDSPWRWVVIGGSYGFALSTAILRVASGSHFASDVIVGALVGSAVGFVVPMLHRVRVSGRDAAGKTAVAAGQGREKPSCRLLVSPAAIAISLDLN